MRHQELDIRTYDERFMVNDFEVQLALRAIAQDPVQMDQHVRQRVMGITLEVEGCPISMVREAIGTQMASMAGDHEDF